MSLWQLRQGDALSELSSTPTHSAHSCVTSPPYFGLRDYGIEGQIGLEQTPQEYIARLVSVFGEVHRVLRDDGTLWIVIGDSYARNPAKGQHRPGDGTAGKHTPVYAASSRASSQSIPAGTKEKDLIGIPWLLAFALRDAGWYLRQEIIWAKGISGPVYRGGSCMPESVKDRCTKSFETVFLLAKSLSYYFDYEAIQEPAQDWSKGGPGVGIKKTTHYGSQSGGNGGLSSLAARYQNGEGSLKRNRRSVWHVNPQPFKGAHFATFPFDLIEPMILAGCPPQGTVLDPFAGSGTTGLVALRHGRNFIGVELNPQYVEIARPRLAQAWNNTKDARSTQEHQEHA